MSVAIDEIAIDAVEAKASGSSFYAAMRLMPKAERRAMFAIYAFCRVVDDIAERHATGQRLTANMKPAAQGWARTVPSSVRM